MCRAPHSKRPITIVGLFPLLIAAFIAVVIVVPAAPAGAKPLSQQKAAAEAKIAKVQAQLDALHVTLERTVERYNLANIKLTAAQKRVAKSTRELKLARLELGAARDTLSRRVVAIYKQRPGDIMDVFFTASSFTDITSVIRDWDEIGSSDSQVVSNVKRSVARVRTRRHEFVAARADARRFVAEVGEKKQTIESSIAQQQHIYQTEKATVRRIEKREAAIAAAAAAKAAEAARVAARAAAAAAARAAAAPAPATPSTPADDPAETPTVPTSVPTSWGHPEVIAIARHYLGVPYLYGGASPSTGFDCSGFVMYCYAQIGISLPHYSGYQQNMGRKVPMTSLLPGDLVFKGYPVSYHVGMYAGGGQVIHSPHTGDVVSFTPLAGWQYAVRLP
jgi:peptidoglycan DL-endopeptidase CwlO